MFGADFVVFCITGGLLVVKLLWTAGVRTHPNPRRSEDSDAVREAIRIVEAYEARLTE